MSELRTKAIVLRLQGKSYNEIHAQLGIPKSTLSNWLQNVALSDEAQKRIAARVREGSVNGLVKRNKQQTIDAQKRNKKIRLEAKGEITSLSLHELKLIGIALYWGEGYKRAKVRDGKERTSHTISLVNADPEMVRVFILFLKKCMDIAEDKIRLCMRLYEHIDEEEARVYWMNVTGLPHTNFFKTTYLVSGASKGIRPFNRLPYGTLQIEVCSTAQFHRLMGWIEGMKEGL